jgi:hypothetical protein
MSVQKNTVKQTRFLVFGMLKLSIKFKNMYENYIFYIPWNIIFKNVEGLTKIGFVVFEIHGEVPKMDFSPHCAPVRRYRCRKVSLY